ncbi:hypothetical protein H0H93_003549 [Arthromyces matolae]|nr:hypothetical protein H0H93_003549 [Arthromyces matolae]
MYGEPIPDIERTNVVPLWSFLNRIFRHDNPIFVDSGNDCGLVFQRFVSFCIVDVQQIGKRHHKEDVIVGSLIGILAAFGSYLIFWPNPFSHETFLDGYPALPRDLYTQNEFGGPQSAIQLDRMEGNEVTNV